MSDLCTEQDVKDRLSDSLVTLLQDDDQDGSVSGSGTESTALSRCITDASVLVIAKVRKVIDISTLTYATCPALIRQIVSDIATYYLCERRNQLVQAGTPVANAYMRAVGEDGRGGTLGEIVDRQIVLEDVKQTSYRLPVVQNLRVGLRGGLSPIVESPTATTQFPPRKYSPRSGRGGAG